MISAHGHNILKPPISKIPLQVESSSGGVSGGKFNLSRFLPSEELFSKGEVFPATDKVLSTLNKDSVILNKNEDSARSLIRHAANLIRLERATKLRVRNKTQDGRMEPLLFLVQ